jgi:hypothetical protein
MLNTNQHKRFRKALAVVFKVLAGVLIAIMALLYSVFGNAASDDLPNGWLKLYAFLILALGVFFYWCGQKLSGG